MQRFFRGAADRETNSPFKNDAFAKFGSLTTKAIRNSRIPPPFRRVRVPLISPEIFKAKLDQSSFEQDDNDKEKKDVKDAKEVSFSSVKIPVSAAKPDEDGEDSDTSFTSTSSGSDSTSSSSSEDEDIEEAEECPESSSDERVETLISQSSSYAVKQIKADMAKGKLAKKLEAKNEPLFNKPLELCEASLQYLDEKCSLKPGERESKTVIKQSQEEYQRNRAAFRNIRRMDWEKRHLRREKRRQAFNEERSLEAKLEKQSNEDDESSDEDEEEPVLVQSMPLE